MQFLNTDIFNPNYPSQGEMMAAFRDELNGN